MTYEAGTQISSYRFGPNGSSFQPLSAVATTRAPNKFIIGDLPFCSYRQGLPAAMLAMQKLMQAGANAVKLEGAVGNEELIAHAVASGIPVMGHLGLTPQSVQQLGGYIVQGRTEKSAEVLLTQAQSLQQAGCFAIVLECIPPTVAKTITEQLTIPTIGIGAGPATSGQVLVLHDMLGLSEGRAKFVKQYLSGTELINSAITNYINEVKSQQFPTPQHCYHG